MRNGSHSAGKSSSSTSSISQQEVDDDRMIAVVLSEEYAQSDRAVGRRLSNLAPVPLKDHRPQYESYVPMKYKHYYKKLAKAGEWGDHVTLQAAPDKVIFVSVKNPCYYSRASKDLPFDFIQIYFIEITPRHEALKRELWLSFWSEVHYNSLYDIQDAPVQGKPRRKHWLF